MKQMFCYAIPCNKDRNNVYGELWRQHIQNVNQGWYTMFDDISRVPERISLGKRDVVLGAPFLKNAEKLFLYKYKPKS